MSALNPDHTSFRRFGIAEADLAIDFRGPNQASLVTRLLNQCAVRTEQTAPEGFYRELSAGKRLEYLLTLAAEGPQRSLMLIRKCGNCGAELEVELTVAELSALQREVDAIETIGVELGGGHFNFRKPKGSDQEAWEGMVFRDEREAALAMIQTLAVDRGMPAVLQPESIRAIEEAFDEADPLIDFKCSIECAECGASNEYRIDLMETALAILDRNQQQLFAAVHQLASHYHWNEKEIFAVPDWRRRQYLKFISTSGK